MQWLILVNILLGMGFHIGSLQFLVDRTLMANSRREAAVYTLLGLLGLVTAAVFYLLGFALLGGLL